MNPKRSALGRFAPWVAVAVGAATFLFHPSPAWVESYANGAYARWEHIAFPVTNAIPWSLGDVVVLAGVALLVYGVRRAWGSRWPFWRRLLRVALDVLAIACVYFAWFEASWGWNYDRAPIETRLHYDAQRANPRAVDALRARAIAEMNRLAVRAHDEGAHGFELSALSAAWLPVVRAGGDTWSPLTGAPKPTIADPFMNATATSGFINPLTLNVQLASDLLPFEWPFSLAHEWSHVAGYAREDEANYLAIVACTRSNDALIAYSGWVELFLYLPPRARYAKKTFVPQVWADFDAIRKRNASRINARLASLSWRTYNVYLKSNRIASGVMNYNEVTRLYLGIPLDRSGLPR